MQILMISKSRGPISANRLHRFCISQADSNQVFAASRLQKHLQANPYARPSALTVPCHWANIRIMPEKTINILGIETSCDETAAAVVADGKTVKSSIVTSQAKLHEKYGGVVPEIASRAHIENIYPVITEALKTANVTKDDIAAIAVANQPGLAVALVVGVTAAKTLSMAWNKPLIAVNHLHAHLQSAMIAEQNLQLPAIALIVSGGHTCLYDCESPLELKLIGRCIDDAAGEAFDKVATILKLPYPGGPSIENAAQNGQSARDRFSAFDAGS